MFFEEAAEKCVAERSEFVPFAVWSLIVIRELSEIDSAQPLSLGRTLPPYSPHFTSLR